MFLPLFLFIWQENKSLYYAKASLVALKGRERGYIPLSNNQNYLWSMTNKKYMEIDLRAFISYVHDNFILKVAQKILHYTIYVT